MPLVAMFALTAWAFETLIPSENEIKLTTPSNSWYLSYNVWPPYVAAVAVGSLQVPLVLFMATTLGGSTSLVSVVVQFFVGPLRGYSAYAENHRWGFKGCWQIFYVLGAVLGGFISAAASGTLGSTVGVPAHHAFVGGFILYLGTRIGGGCTSGHGLSGMGLLSILSFIMIACTFGTAIVSGFLLRAVHVI
jgi:uncharacterized membrane protein YedE/YeeE